MNHGNLGGVAKERLAPCPQSKRNCICSFFSSHKKHYLPPISLSAEKFPLIWSQLMKYMEAKSEARLKKKTQFYLHYEWSSPLLGFIDDVEFLWDSHQEVLHFRSASRSGYWDLGANGSRIRRILKNLSLSN